MRFDKYLRTTLEQAELEARSLGSKTVEAEHVLLAIAAQPQTTAAQLLCSMGLDHDAIRNALQREFEHSLSVAGLSLAAFDLRSAATPEPSAYPGASVRNALERATAGVRNLRPLQLLFGILQAQVGTVPRALKLAGVDRAELMMRVEQTLAAECA